VKDTPLLPCQNHFDVLAVEEIKTGSSTTTDISPVPETKKTWKSKLEKKLSKLNIGTTEEKEGKEIDISLPWEKFKPETVKQLTN